MNTYKIALTTRTGQFIEAEIKASSMVGLIQPLAYQLAVQHSTAIDDVVELDITELD